jgi:cytochrome c oxidase subunit 2
MVAAFQEVAAMDNDLKSLMFRVAGIAGLVILLGLVVLAERTTGQAGTDRREATSVHDHSDPSQHGHKETRSALSTDDAAQLPPSGSVEDGVRVADYEAFRYGFAPDPLVVRAGEKVRLRVKSRDVTHGMAIPDIEFSATIEADAAKDVEFTAPATPGRYSVFCSVYCGPKHGNMRGEMVVLPTGTEAGHD